MIHQLFIICLISETNVAIYKEKKKRYSFYYKVFLESRYSNLFIKLILFASKAYSFYFYVNPHSYCIIVLNRK